MQIAHALGISHTAVGSVLNDKADKRRISPQTQRLVRAKARLMGYQSPQLPAKKLRKSTICYCATGPQALQTRTIWAYMNALHVEAMKDKWQVMFMTLSSDPPALAEYLQVLEKQEPLGIILDGAVTEAAVTAMAQLEIPLVVSGATEYAHNPELMGSVNAVSIDVTGGIDQLMQCFYQQGARRVALSLGEPEMTYHPLILDAYRQAVAQAGQEYDPILVHTGKKDSSEPFVRRLSDRGVDYDAILLGSADRVIRILSYLNLATEQTHLQPLVGAFGDQELAAGLPENVSVCGPCLNDWGAEIYRMLSAEIRYAAKKKRVSIVPCVLHPAAMTTEVT